LSAHQRGIRVDGVLVLSSLLVDPAGAAAGTLMHATFDDTGRACLGAPRTRKSSVTLGRRNAATPLRKPVRAGAYRSAVAPCPPPAALYGSLPVILYSVPCRTR